jgi:Na+/phosphate symporter
MVILVSLLIAILGLLLYVMSSNAKFSEVGRIMLFVGLLATLLRTGPAAVSFLK